MAAAGQALEAAVASKVEPPESVLQSMPMGDASQISFLGITQYNNVDGSGSSPQGFDIDSIPYAFHLSDMDTSFVR